MNQKSERSEVIREIEHQIMTGELVAGDKLPSERDLTAKYNISRVALRESLKSLEMLGLLESKQGSGTFVANNVTKSILLPTSLSFKMANGSAEQIIEFRELMETFAICKACEKMSDERINELISINNEMMTEPDPEEKDGLNAMFHTKMIANTENFLVITFYENALHMLDGFTQRISYNVNINLQEIYDEHLEMINAIKAKDVERACSVVHRHLDRIISK